MEAIKNWASTMCVTVIFISIAYLLLHTGEMKKHVKFALSLILLSVMIKPIINFLSFDELKIENPFKVEQNSIESNKNNAFIYSDDYLIETLENALSQKLKLKYEDKNFEVKINGTMDIDNMKADIKKVDIGVLDNKKIKKVEKVTIGDVESYSQQETPFLKEVKEMVSTELQISKEKVNIGYI